MSKKQWDKMYQNEHGVLINKLGIEFDDNKRDQEEAIISYKILTTEIQKFRKIDPFNKNSINKIHSLLFSEVYEWAGEFRKVNISKDGHSFLPFQFFDRSVQYIFNDKFDSFESIVEKYNEINLMHAFREGNGRTGRIWLNLALEKKLGIHINFGRIAKEDYMDAMKAEDHKNLAKLFKRGITEIDKANYEKLWIHNAKISYEYEGYYIPEKDDHELDTEIGEKYKTYEEYLESRNKNKKDDEKERN